MLLLSSDALNERRAAVQPGAPLAPLCDGLAAELAPWLGSAPYVPVEKALLSRKGGRCEHCGGVLEFDPASPRSHGCPACARVHTGELHDRAWVMRYQLWLAERAVHAALLHLLRGDPAHAQFARDVVQRYAAQYLGYPNTDNVLGPTRLFFSTYLESIWLLQICVAAELLEAAGDDRTAGLAREKIIEPSSAIIAGFDEGMSNRQVWNNAALIAASALLGRRDAIDRLANGNSGVHAHLTRALLQDGTWYEGENYHQFALRGLWYAVTMLEGAGATLQPDLRDRFQRAFAAPFTTALPDFTMPSRKDSQYAVPLRQWHIAELTELGFARRQDAMLGGALLRLYDDAVPRAETGRSRSTADVERNMPASRLTRADLGWRALLHALPELPPLPHAEPRSALLASQGYAVFRRDGGIYVGFEFGQSGGGHGHPDRLNLTLYENDRRWLDDLGTGSYVDPSLHWYRSTLAHNAPLVNGRSQPIRDGALLAYDEREGLGWIAAEFRIPEDHVRLERAIVVAPDYVIDELRWEAGTAITVDLPFHVDVDALGGTPVALEHSARPEDGFAYLHDVQRLADATQLRARGGNFVLHPLSSVGMSWFRGMAPGQPPTLRLPLVFARMSGRSGTVRCIISLTGSCRTRPETDDTLWIQVVDGEWHGHRRDANGWHVQLEAGGARSSIDLGGVRQASLDGRHESGQTRAPLILRTGVPAVFELGEDNYRRSEVSWRDAGAPAARVEVLAGADRLVLTVDVRAGDPVFADAAMENPYDNEHADTMRAGVQVYLSLGGQRHAWMLVPEAMSQKVRARSLDGRSDYLLSARWRRTDVGYAMDIELGRPSDEICLDVIINETVAGRERRRGQLVLSGARGEFVYLRGDRHDAERCIPITVLA